MILERALAEAQIQRRSRRTVVQLRLAAGALDAAAGSRRRRRRRRRRCLAILHVVHVVRGPEAAVDRTELPSNWLPVKVERFCANFDRLIHKMQSRIDY